MNVDQSYHSHFFGLFTNGFVVGLFREESDEFDYNMPKVLSKCLTNYQHIKPLIDKQPSIVQNTLAPSLAKIEEILQKQLFDYYHKAIEIGIVNRSISLNPHLLPLSTAMPNPSTSLSIKAKAMKMKLELMELDGLEVNEYKEIANGKAAILECLKTKQNQFDAFVSPSVGSVSIIYGTTGIKKNGKWKGGEGLIHIVVKRNEEKEANPSFFKLSGKETALKLIEVIVLGKIIRTTHNNTRVNIAYEGYEAVLSLENSSNRITWLLTGFQVIDETLLNGIKNEEVELRQVSTNRQPTQQEPTFSRLRVGASSKYKNKSITDKSKPFGYLGRLLVQKFSSVKEIDRKQIDVRPDWFQGRQTAYSQESFDKIVREGFDKSQEPIAVWLDPETNTYIVISGHSRWHASEELFKRGQKDLKTMPVKIFQGTKEEAKDFAILESNRSGTAEGLLSDLKAYKRAVSKDYTIDKLKDLFKPEAHLRLLKDLSYLKETGKFIENLASDAAKSFPYLQRNAQWVGIIRKIYPNLTNFHEGELFDFFYSTNKKSLGLNKEQFFNQIELRVNRLDFDPTKPLNMRNMISHAVVTAPGRDYLREIESELKEATDERNKLELLIARAKQEGKDNLIPDFKTRLTATNNRIMVLVERKDKTERELKALERNTQDDLFSSLIQRSEPTLEEIRIQKFALKTKALKMKLALLEV